MLWNPLRLNIPDAARVVTPGDEGKFEDARATAPDVYLISGRKSIVIYTIAWGSDVYPCFILAQHYPNSYCILRFKGSELGSNFHDLTLVRDAEKAFTNTPSRLNGNGLRSLQWMLTVGSFCR